MQNRLRLNWDLSTREERNQFVTSYLEVCPFKHTLTQKELNTLSDYILWGENSEGKNGRQEGLQLETSSKTWDLQKVESLDALIESPTFTESSIRSSLNPPSLIPREVFSRSRARLTAPPLIRSAFESIWTSIDKTELLVTLYELAHDRRTKEVRPELLARFQPHEFEALHDRAQSLDQFTYLKLKHQLVDLRREQYTIKDSYAPVLQTLPSSAIDFFESPTFDSEISILPFGISNNTDFYKKIFRSDRFPIPEDFTETELERLSLLIWNRPAPSTLYVDFCNVQHLSEIFNMWDDLIEASYNPNLDENFDSNLKGFVDTLSSYWRLSNLEPFLNDILLLKIKKVTNQKIADIINSKYNKAYKPNYISTLYYKKCLGEIAQTASNHLEVLENLFFKENFKKCKDCGEVLLLNEKNFVKRKRSNDGFSPRCKRCEKVIRDRSK